MGVKSFSKGEAIKFGWATMKANIGFFIGILIVITLIQFGSIVINRLAVERSVVKQDFLSITGDTDGLFANLIENEYIVPNGVIQGKFRGLEDYNDMQLGLVYENQKAEIYNVLQQALARPLFLVIILFIAVILFWALNRIIEIGLTKISIKFCDNEKSKFKDLFSHYPLFFKYLFGSILYVLIVFGGMILLIIPGIIWAIKFQFFNYLIVDKGLGPVEALKKSWVITKGAKWNLFVFGLLLALINLIGILCLVIGLFATLPTTLVAIAFVYRKLLAQTELVKGPETL